MEDNFLLQMIRGNSNQLKNLRIALGPKFHNWVWNYFFDMREYELGINFMNLCYKIMYDYRDEILTEDYEYWDRELIVNKLRLLDRLNYWYEYIQFFNYCREHKRYTITYVKDRNDTIFNDYILYADSNYKYVHFLYLSHNRYEIVKKKYYKLTHNKNVEHLKCHQKYKLSNEEIDSRYERLYCQLTCYLQQNNDFK